MSTILKALRRLEQDRAAEAEPSLEAAVLGRDAAAEADRKTPRWLALALAAAALGAGAALLLERSGVMNPVAASPVATAASPALQPAPPVASAPPVLLPDASALAAPAPLALAPPAEPESPPAPAVAAPPPELADAIALAGLPEEPLDLPGLPAPGGASDTPLPPPAPSASASSAPQTPERVARLEPRMTPPKAALPGRAARGGDVGAVVAQPVTRGGLDAGEEEGVRSVEPPRKRTARVAPASTGISVLRTVWHPKPERRTAWLEAPGDASPHEFREGDRVGSVTLLRIEPSAVIFERDGVELRERIAERP